MKNFESPNEAICDLRNRGYETDFSVGTFCLYCGDLDMRLSPEQFTVDEEYRFDGDPAHEENTVLVAITASSGVKGVLLDSSGAYAEAGLSLTLMQSQCNLPPR